MTPAAADKAAGEPTPAAVPSEPVAEEATESPVAEAEEKAVEEVKHVEYVVLSDFDAFFHTQLLHFAEGTVLGHEVGAFMHAGGGPVKPVK
jgi:hypothetical protein